MGVQMPLHLSPRTKDVLEVLRQESSNAPFYLMDLLDLLAGRFINKQRGETIQRQLASHRTNVARNRPPKMYFDLARLLSDGPKVPRQLGLEDVPLSPEIIFQTAVHTDERYWSLDEDGDAVCQLHDAELTSAGKAEDHKASRKLHSQAFGRNLTAMAYGWSDPPLGSFTELPQSVRDVLVQLFAGYQVPLLVGEAGVGKSTIARQVAYMLKEADRRVHPELHKMRVLSVTRADLVAGTDDRGALESRVQTLVQMADRSTQNIVFLDEIHALFDGSPEANTISNILKPPMAEGKLRCFGATTRAEFDRYLTGDPPLVERFKLCFVQEPRRDDLVAAFLKSPESILTKSELDGWDLSPEAREAAVDLSIRFMPLQRLPRKAANLLRAAAAECRFDDPQRESKTISVGDVQATLGRMMSLPDRAFATSPKEISKSLATSLIAEIKGHNTRIMQIADNLCAREKLREKGLLTNRPLASYLFLGPEGVGKRALAYALARHHFAMGSTEREFVSEVNVSGFVGEQGLNRFRGAAPGYVGYGETPAVFRDPRTSPRRIILIEGLDASSGLAEAVGSILQSGVGFDGSGRPTDYSGCVMILIATAETDDLQLVKPHVDRVFPFDTLNANSLEEFAATLAKRSEGVLKIQPPQITDGCRLPVEVIHKWQQLLISTIQQ